MHRCSLRTLMLLILVVAIELTALRNANIVWARVMAMFTIGVIGLAVLWAALRRGQQRAWWTGFALTAAAYVAVSSARVAHPLHDPSARVDSRESRRVNGCQLRDVAMG